MLAEMASGKLVERKSVLFMEGFSGHSIYLLGSGNIQLHKTSPEGAETVIKIVQPGELFAEVILFESDIYPVTATALVDSYLCSFSKTGILKLLSREDFRNDFIALLLGKQRYLAEKIHSLTQHDVEERFFAFLREHFGDQKEIKISLSKKEVAAAISTTPETLSRLILKLQNEGRLNWEGKKIEITRS